MLELIECGIEHADECLIMRKQIFEALKAKGEEELYLADETDAEFRRFFQGGDSYAVGFRNQSDGRLISCAISSFRKEPLERFKNLIPGAFRSNYDVAYFELAQVEVVSQELHLGLQCKMEQALEVKVKEYGARYFTAIVSPNNKVSLHNLTKLGFEKVGEFIHQETGFSRLLVCKKFPQ